MPDIVFLNDRFVNYSEAKISIEDRGFQFGDGIYEVVRCYNGKPFCLDEHLKRMLQGLEALKIKAPYSSEKLKGIALEALSLSGLKDAQIYIQITRGVAPRRHAFIGDMKPTTVLIVRKIPDIDPKIWEEGVSAIVMPDIRWHLCYIKTVQLVPNCLAKVEAEAQGAFEAVFERDGIVTEAASSNVFIVKKGKALTHPANERILHGISRGVAIELIKQLEIPFAEEAFTVEELYDADEVFLTGTISEVLPVRKIGDKLIGNGKPGPLTRKIQEAFINKVNEVCG
ncbi:MAG: D-alanine transaminase [Thermosediminibacterales bacterium]|nr:D-alanine transaminase [Thermosediminibacterales bacterium]